MKRLFWIAMLLFVLGLITTVTFGLIARNELRSFAQGEEDLKNHDMHCQRRVED